MSQQRHCDACKENLATIHLKIIIHQNIQEIDLCERCKRPLGREHIVHEVRARERVRRTASTTRSRPTR